MSVTNSPILVPMAEPRFVKAVITASATSAAATAYSESSRPVSSRKNFFNISFCSFCVWVSESRVSGPCETPGGDSRTPACGLQLQAACVKKSVTARLRAARSDEQLIPLPSVVPVPLRASDAAEKRDRKSTRLNSSHTVISYAVFCLKKKKKNYNHTTNI